MATHDTNKAKWFSPLLIGVILIVAIIIFIDGVKKIAKKTRLILHRTAQN